MGPTAMQGHAAGHSGGAGSFRHARLSRGRGGVGVEGRRGHVRLYSSSAAATMVPKLKGEYFWPSP